MLRLVSISLFSSVTYLNKIRRVMKEMRVLSVIVLWVTFILVAEHHPLFS